MAIREVVTFPAPILRQRAAVVPAVTDEIRMLLDDMLDTMYAANGVGLAAPQVGVSLRLAVIDTGEPVPGRDDPNDTIIKAVNPEIVDREGEISFEEGCLSVPEFTQVMKRSRRIRVTFRDETGIPRDIVAEGLLSIAFQQEIDHLDGKLIIDEISPLKQDIYLRKRKKSDDKR